MSSTHISNADLEAAERAMVEDLVAEHGYVGSARLALRLLEHVCARMTPDHARDAWRRAVVVPVGDLALFLARLDAAGGVGRPRRRPRPQA